MTRQFFVSKNVVELIDGISDLAALYDYWQSKIDNQSDEAAMPDISSIDLAEIPGNCDSVMYLEKIGDPHDYVYLHYGAAIAKVFGSDMTGKKISTLSAIPVSKFITIYNAIVKTGLSHYSLHQIDTSLMSGEHHLCWERLMLPVADQSGGVARILCVNFRRNWDYRSDLYQRDSCEF